MSGIEVLLDEKEIIVSKTDLKGRIVYANDMFLKVSSFTNDEVIGKPHNLVRHPSMPMCIFKMLWDRVHAGEEIFAYVINRTKNDDYYWVCAHVTPRFDFDGTTIGYHSNRRAPQRNVLNDVIIPLYKKMIQAEEQAGRGKAGMEASAAVLSREIEKQGAEDYDEFISNLRFNQSKPSSTGGTYHV